MLTQMPPTKIKPIFLFLVICGLPLLIAESTNEGLNLVTVSYDGQTATFLAEQQMTLKEVKEYFGVSGGGLKYLDSQSEIVLIAKNSDIIPSGEYVLEVPPSASPHFIHSSAKSKSSNSSPLNNALKDEDKVGGFGSSEEFATGRKSVDTRSFLEDGQEKFMFQLRCESSEGNIHNSYFRLADGLISENDVAKVSITGDYGREYTIVNPSQQMWHPIELTRDFRNDLYFWQWRADVIQGRLDVARMNCTLIAFDSELSKKESESKKAARDDSLQSRGVPLTPGATTGGGTTGGGTTGGGTTGGGTTGGGGTDGEPEDTTEYFSWYFLYCWPSKIQTTVITADGQEPKMVETITLQHEGLVVMGVDGLLANDPEFYV